MQYHNNILCVSGQELLSLVPKGTFDTLKARGQANVIQRACYGKPALIELDSLPVKYREMVITKFGEPEKQAMVKPFKDKIVPDAQAITFYGTYKLADGRELATMEEGKYLKEYSTNASVLNAIKEIYTNASTSRKALGGSMKGFWEKAQIAIEGIRAETGHTLPGNKRKLQEKYKSYTEEGYEALISKKFCNDNSRKVTSDIERLLMSLYTMPNKPFAADVHVLYQRFINGSLQVADSKTGELFIPANFIQNGKPLEITRQTVWSYLNQPHNRFVVDSKRNGQFEYNNMHRPHHHRNAPQYSFSKISMDDRDLPRKLEGGGRVKAYYSYDVTSGCVVGKSYSREKNEALFIDCVQDMFRTIEREGFGMPLEVEVENHLVKEFFDDLRIMFPYVRVCNPGNSQEKHAEHLNRAKKYGVEKKTQNAIGRWWAKSEAYRIDSPKINDEHKEIKYTYERLVADDEAAVIAFNNELHPKQKKYPGKTRWQVLVENMNPNIAQVSKAVVYKSIGERTKTTIRRNQYVTVQYAEYQLPSPAVIERLTPNNYEVEAYYLPDADGIIGEVYLYQAGTFLCKAEKISKYNTAKAEWTNSDDTAYTDQAKYVSQFDKRTKEGKNKLVVPVLINPQEMIKATEQSVKIFESEAPETDDIENLINQYNPNDYAQKANDNL